LPGEPIGDAGDVLVGEFAGHLLHLDQLAYLPDRRPNSRLSCQVLMSDALDGLKVTLAPGSVR
jgi:hypothetical protein